MPMPQRVQYSDAIEPLVQFIEDTPPAEILDRTLDKLRAGVSTQTMLTASALAVTRSTEMPPGHHGGPLHPPGERMAEALHEVRQSLQRNLEAKKGGAARSCCAGSRAASTGGCKPSAGSRSRSKSTSRS